MPKFSSSSKDRLKTCHTDLQKIFNAIIVHYDCCILEGYRTDEKQEKLYLEGKTKCRAGQSKHNHSPSLAVDVAPYPIDWQDTKRFYHFAGYVNGVADELGIIIRSGADWSGKHVLNDQTFFDLVHFELKVV